jgi:DNA-binding transcriptional regulator GbsR (MarR family)
MCLYDIVKTTGYSSASISLSLDLLEIVGIIKKFKHKGDRRLYVRLDGDLIEGLRNALLLKLRKEIAQTLNELEEMKKDEKNRKTVKTIEKEIKRLQEYVTRLSKVPLPKK